MKQHLDSYNYFVQTELKKVVAANSQVRSDVDPEFYLKYLDIRVGFPERLDQEAANPSLTPQECRLRDLTYAANIYVDIEYKRGKSRVLKKGEVIGRIPVMLRSCRCILAGKGEAELARLQECPLDPGGYFIVNGTEKVILVQEQLSKNRIIVEKDSKGCLVASVTSSTHERKSKTYVVYKAEKVYLRHNSIVEDLPIMIALKVIFPFFLLLRAVSRPWDLQVIKRSPCLLEEEIRKYWKDFLVPLKNHAVWAYSHKDKLWSILARKSNHLNVHLTLRGEV